MNLHAFSVFFCMDASDAFAGQRNQHGVLQTEHTPPPDLYVLQSDHSIPCNTAAHNAARAVGAVAVLCLVVGMPCAFVRSIRALLDSADLLHGERAASEEGLTAAEAAKSRKAFSAADTNGNGTLDEAELTSVLEAQTGIAPSRREMKEMKERLGFVHGHASAEDEDWCAPAATLEFTTVPPDEVRRCAALPTGPWTRRTSCGYSRA
jgi:hypothetical protein